MIGSGKNRKSLSYVGNVTAFLEETIKTNSRYILVNYVDEPTLDINSLVSLLRKELLNTDKVGLRIPFFVGFMIGLIADLVSVFLKKPLSISSLRVKKFCSNSFFMNSLKNRIKFSPPFSIEAGLKRTINYEFKNNDPKREVFYTE